MKKTIILLTLLIVSIFSFAQVNLQSLVKPGAKLIYLVEANGQKYDFIVTVKTLTPAPVFDWQMTEPASISGTITHTATAMVSANALYNYFSPGAKTLDDNTLSVWISKNSFAALTKGTKSAMITMNTNESPKKMTVTQEDPDELHIIVDGEKETVEEWVARQQGVSSDDAAYFGFSTSAKIPIILKMNNEFSLLLKEIKTK